MQTPPIEVRDPETDVLLGMRCMVHGIVKYVPIHRDVVAALRAFREAMKIEESYSEPEWDDLSEEEEKDLIKFNSIDSLIRQAF